MSTATHTKGAARCFTNSRGAMTWFDLWQSGQEIPDCLGVMFERIYEDTGETQVLPAWVPFEGQDNADWHAGSTADWPVQSACWYDGGAKPGRKFHYRITPRVGTPGKLSSRDDLAVITNTVELVKKHGRITFGVNSGILATQDLAHRLGKGADGKPDWQKLATAIKTVGDPLREELAGDLLDMVRWMFSEARRIGGHLYELFYEFDDPEAVELHEKNLDIFSLILGNTGEHDDVNKATRAKLHALKAKVFDRILPEGHIAHNKVIVLTDAHGKAIAVLVLTANMTATGFCGQTNCAFLIEIPEVAAIYLDLWHRTQKEGNGQSKEYRAANAAVCSAAPHVEPDGSTVRVCIAPCTQDEVKPQHNAPMPAGMEQLFKMMDECEKLILMHLFFPGFPSVLSKSQEIAKTHPDVMQRGVVNSSEALPRPRSQAGQGAQGTTGSSEPKADVALLHGNASDPDLVAATALEEVLGPFIPELLRATPESHASTHAKAVDGDPMDPKKSKAAAGSNNMGYKADYQNDDNFVIIVGNQSLSIALAVFILHVYFHYRTRWMLHIHKSKFNGFLIGNSSWQAKYVKAGDARKMLDYWMGNSSAKTV